MRIGGKLAVCTWTMLAVAWGPRGETAAPVVEEVNVREHRDAAGKSWQRIMIGGLPGGDGYFARNIGHGADGENAGNDARAELWTFTDVDLGKAHGRARIALSNVDDGRGAKEWAAIFGGGHDDAPGAARLFVLFIDRGIDGWASGGFVKITAGAPAPRDHDGQPNLPNALGEPALLDIDLNGTADLAYAGDMQGNLFRFDISDSDPSAWRAVRLFQATYGEPVERLQPITQRPFAVMHPGDGDFLVVFGTGSDRAGNQGANTDIQSIYGIWDPGESDPATARPGARGERLVGRAPVNVVDDSSGQFETRRVLTGGPVNYARDTPGRTGVYGWTIDLDMPRAERTLDGNLNPDSCGQAPPGPQYPGERVVGRPVPRGNVLFMATAIPGDVQVCSGAPPGSVFAIDMFTGASPEGGVLDLNDDGRIDTGDLVPFEGQSAVSGVVLDGRAFSGTLVQPTLVSSRDGSATLTVGAGDEGLSLGVGGAGAVRTGRRSWREISDATP